MKRQAWVVEMMFDEHGPLRNDEGWSTCSAIALARNDARLVMAEWKAKNPCDRFRIVKYVPAEPEAKPSHD